MSKNDINNGKFDEIMSTMMTSTDARHRFHAMKLRAEDGDVGAMCGVGNCYFFGEGVIQNYAESVRWYRKAAEQGYADGQYNLGYCYEYGKGVKQDNPEAVKWYCKAVEQGNTWAEFPLKRLT